MLTAHHAVGGGARHARSLARGLRELGVRVSLLCTGASDPRGDRDYDEVIACQPRSWPVLWRFQPLGTMPFWYRTVRRSATRMDAVISLSAPLAVATRWALPKMPLLFAPAMLDRLEHPNTPRSPYKWFEKRAFRSADCVLARSQAVREAIEAHYGTLRRPVGICLPGVEEAAVTGPARTRAELGIPPNAKLLVTVGLVNENKGQRYIARALAGCAGPEWWWALIGGGDGQARVREELRGSGVEQRTLMIGVDHRPADWYAAADLLVAASQSETFGQAIAEALRAGLPVVIPRNEPGATLSPLADCVERHRLGHVFDRRDTESLRDVLSAALADEHVLQEMSRRGVAFARANFIWSRYAECALRLLESSSDLVYDTVPPDQVECDAVGLPRFSDPSIATVPGP